MENKIIKYGLFWEPPQSICNFINYWKGQVRAVEPNANFLDHPVHTTFFLMMGLKRDYLKLVKSLELIIEEYHSFMLNFSGWRIFENDAATEGGNTLTLVINPNPEILYLQKKIALAMVGFKKTSVPYNANWQGQFAQSYNAWGFPFVGEHWIPHISVASVHKKGQIIINEALYCNNLPKSEFLKSLALFEITEKYHRNLYTFQLK